MLERNIVTFEKHGRRCYSVYDVDAFKWIESEGGIDVVNDVQSLQDIVDINSMEILEYLLKERGLTASSLLKRRAVRVNLQLMKIIFNVKGAEEVRKIDYRHIEVRYREVEFLKSINYPFNKQKILNYENGGEGIYALLCWNVLDFNDVMKLHHAARQRFSLYFAYKDPKACKQTYPFMKKVRQQKIMTVLLCFSRCYGKMIPSQIVWTIIDYAYSPINERGGWA